MTAVLFVAMTCTVGQPSDEPVTAIQEISAWQKYCRSTSKGYRIYPARDPGQPFERIPDPVLIHNQPVRGDQTGEVYIWVGGDRRPAAISTVIVAPERESPGMYYVVRESHSLYHEPISGVLGTRRWSPKGPGVEWKRVPDAPVPKAGSSRLLNLQARHVASDFHAFVVERGTQESAAERVNLRRLPRPLYSYDAEDTKDCLCGAVFGFCMATDLEIILSIEARKTGEGPRWFYACAGFSDLDMHVQLKDSEIWTEAPAFSKPGGVHIGFTTRHVVIGD